MAFPTIPTSGASRALVVNQANTTAARTFPSLSSLTKNAGDLLIAIVIAYQSSATADAVWSGWGAGFTEVRDTSTTSGMAIGVAYLFSSGAETGTFTVTQAATVTGFATMMLLSVSGANATLPPETTAATQGTAAAADPPAISPSWGSADTLWIAVGGNGETSLTGSFAGVSSIAPTGYDSGTLFVDHSGLGQDVVGALDTILAFKQAAAATEDAGVFTVDLSNAKNAAMVIAVPPVFVAPELVMAPRVY